MSIARHHTEWLSLLEISGPFLSMPVLMRAFPQGLDAADPEVTRQLRLAYGEWLTDQHSLRPSTAIHTAWVRFVLSRLLDMPQEVIAQGQAIPECIKAVIPVHGETLRPDIAILPPPQGTIAEKHSTPSSVLPSSQGVIEAGASAPSSVFPPYQGGTEGGDTYPRFLIQVIPFSQGLDKVLPGQRWKASPASRMAELLRGANVRAGLITNGEQWMLVDAPRNGTAGFISWYAALWLEESITLRAFCSLLGARRFFGVQQNETLEALLAESAGDQHEVTDQLGYQVRRAIEVLVQSIDRADQDRNRALLANVAPAQLYEAALTVMMRLVFLLCAEERGLLLLGDPLYDQHYAISTLGAQLRETADQHGEEVLERRFDAWYRLLATFRAVHNGVQHDLFNLPAYGGGLFDPDRYPFLEGRGTEFRDSRLEIEPQSRISNLQSLLPINNRTVLHLLEALQVLRVKVPGGGAAEARRLSFRALDVEQIGHVYEGLLDHTAVRASEPALGLIGAKDKEPEIALAELEWRMSRKDVKMPGEESETAVSDTFIAYLREQTGRSESALRKALGNPPQSPLGKGGGQRMALRLPPLSPLGKRGGQEMALSNPSRPPLGKGGGQEMALSNPSRPPLGKGGGQGGGADRLHAACGNDEALYQRVLPFAGLIRADDFGFPVVIPASSVYVTTGTDRRSSGTHYTPRSLTEPIVQHTLEPLVYNGPAKGLPKEQWTLRPPCTLLDLKVCDMAMGSGAFLVQSCRYLAERLVEAWEQVEQGSRGAGERRRKGATQSTIDHGQSEIGNPKSKIRVTPEGDVSQGKPGETLIPQDDEERLTFARRLVAERCIYGVDKNPLAVEIAKLSMWLTTLDKGRPFTFLDHALKPGDSLVGVNLEQLRYWTLTPPENPTTPELFGTTLREDIDKMVALRAEIERTPDLAPEDLAHKQAKLARAEAIAHDIKQAADLLVGSSFNDLPARTQTALRNALLLVAREMKDVEESLAKTLSRKEDLEGARAGLREIEKMRPFHWPLEFPEVFAGQRAVEGRAGFDAFVGNPPFIGGQRISGLLGGEYLAYLKTRWAHSRGSADICAYFFLRGFDQLHPGGALGLIATNTIAQGDTRDVGLEHIVRQGGIIYRAVNNMPWPGSAAVVVNVIHIANENYRGAKFLDGCETPVISTFLDNQTVTGKPYRLVANTNKSFQGSIVLGMGFVLQPSEAQELISKDNRNAEVIFPYLNGEDLNSRPDQSPSRWVINFFDWPLEKAEQYTDCMAIVRSKVKPERDKQNREIRRRYWWRYGETASALYRTIEPLRRVLVVAQTSRTVAFAFVPNGWVYAMMTVVFPFDESWAFALLQSSLHNVWAWKYASTMKQDLRYTPSDVFEPFPFPRSLSCDHQLIDATGEMFHEHRRQIMLTRQEGLTATYNRFHNSYESSTDIARLRELHVQMDQGVAAAYGWTDLDLGHGFHQTPQGMRYTISESARREVLTRLLQLNHKRYEEEAQAGLHEKKGSRGAGERVRKGKREKRSKTVNEELEQYELI